MVVRWDMRYTVISKIVFLRGVGGVVCVFMKIDRAWGVWERLLFFMLGVDRIFGGLSFRGEIGISVLGKLIGGVFFEKGVAIEGV